MSLILPLAGMIGMPFGPPGPLVQEWTNSNTSAQLQVSVSRPTWATVLDIVCYGQGGKVAYAYEAGPDDTYVSPGAGGGYDFKTLSAPAAVLVQISAWNGNGGYARVLTNPGGVIISAAGGGAPGMAGAPYTTESGKYGGAAPGFWLSELLASYGSGYEPGVAGGGGAGGPVSNGQSAADVTGGGTIPGGAGGGGLAGRGGYSRANPNGTDYGGGAAAWAVAGEEYDPGFGTPGKGFVRLTWRAS